MDQGGGASIDPSIHKALAKNLFNAAWELMEKPDRTSDETDTLIHMAHSSRFHWGVAGAPVHWARGEWQLARVYTLAGRPEPALYHARRCLSLSEGHALGPFDEAFAHEALARAYSLAGDDGGRERHLARAVSLAERVESAADRAWILENLASIRQRAAEDDRE